MDKAMLLISLLCVANMLLGISCIHLNEKISELRAEVSEFIKLGEE